MQNLLKILIPTFLLCTTARAEEPPPVESFGLMFHSDTCGSCEVLNPKIDAVKPDFEEENILFVTFDHTDASTRNQAKLMAEALGLTPVFEAQRKASGFFLVVDADSGEVLVRLDKTSGPEEIREAFQQAVAQP